jgi:hypothetical protein
MLQLQKLPASGSLFFVLSSFAKRTFCLLTKNKNAIVRSRFALTCARRETRTPKVITPTASETATFANFAMRAFLLNKKSKVSFASFAVRMKGLEPPRLAAPDPKSGAAAHYATSA